MLRVLCVPARSGVFAIVLAVSAAASAQEWQHTGGPHGGMVTQIAAGNGFAFAGTAGGLARFDSGAGVWQSLPTSQWVPPSFNPPAVRSIAVLPGAVLASSGTGTLIRSLDNGDTWEQLPGHGEHTGLFADGERLYASGSATGFRRSLDRGSTWEPLNFPGGAGFYARGALLIAGLLDGYVISLDGGQTSQTHPLSLGFALPSHFADASHGIYMAVNSLTSSSARIFRSTNQGASFQQIATVGEVKDMLPVGDAVYILTEEHTLYTNRIWKAAGGALTEVGIVPPGSQSVRALQMTLLGGDLLVGTPDAGVLRSDDGGQTWDTINQGLGFTLVTNMATGDGVALAGLSTGHSVWRYESGVWAPSAPLNGGGNILSLHHLGGTDFLAGTDSEGIFRSSDRGATWTAGSTGLPQYNGSAGLQYREVEDFTHTQSAVFAALGFGTEMINGQFRLSGGGLVRSTDDGATWERVNNGLPVQTTNNFGQPVFDPMICMTSLGQTVFAGSGSTGIFRSTDNGGSWQHVVQLSSVSDMETLGGSVYAAAAEGVFVSGDSGASWSSTGFPGFPRALGVAGGQLHASGFPVGGSGGGIYRLDAGVWHRTDDRFTGVIVRALAGDGPTLYAGTDFLGAWSLGGGGCYADCDGDSTLTLSDFGCFQTKFALGDPYADCNGDTALNLADFGCFQTSFALGCP